MRPRFDELARAAAAAFDSGAEDAAPANLVVARRLALPALTVPSEHGGMGANLLDFASYQQLLATADGSTALVLAMHHMLIGGEAETGAWPAAEWGELCQAAVAEGALVNSAASEPGAGTPSQGGLPGTVARPGPKGGWRITGRKAYTTGAPYLARMRVSARVEPPGSEPYAARFLVRLPADGVTMEDSWKPAALRSAANADVSFEATPGTLLYREGGHGCEGTVWFQVAIAATYLGIGFAAHRAITAFIRDRSTAAGRLADRESVRLRLGRGHAGLEVARRNLLGTCADWVEAAPGQREGLLTAFGIAKVTAVGAAVAAADEAGRLAGAGGLGEGQPFARLLLEARAGLNHPPIDDVAVLRLAERDLAENS